MNEDNETKKDTDEDAVDATSEEAQKRVFLYCRSCKALLPAKAHQCKHCGEQDPFYFKKANKLKTIRDIIILTSGIGIIAYLFLADLLPRDLPEGMLGSILLGGYIGYALVLIFLSNLLYTLVILKKEEEEEMAQLYEDEGHPEGYDDWLEELTDII